MVERARLATAGELPEATGSAAGATERPRGAGALLDRALGALDRLVAQPADDERRPVAPPSLRAGLRYVLLLDRRLIVPLTFLATIFLFCFIRQTDYDWWWHLRTGQLIWEQRAIPSADPYSYTNAGRPWVVHEWLFEVLTYLGYRAIGYNGLSLALGLVLLATFTLHYLLLRALGAGRVLAGLLVAWSGLLTFMTVTMRPQVFSYLFLAVELWCLYLYRSGRRRAVWLLPPIMLLWVNLHGAWIMGLGTLALFVAGEWLNARARGERAALGHAVGALALGTAAIAANPQFLRIYLFPLSFIAPDSATVQYIQEWQPPNFHDFFGYVFGLTVLLLVALGLRRPRFDYTLALWALAFTYLGFSSMRHLPLFALVVVPVIAQQLPASWRGPEWPYRENALTGVVNWVLVLFVVGVIASVMLGNPLVQLRPEPNLTNYPVEGLAYLRAHPGGGNLLNYDAWGGYLIDQLYPTSPVFTDTRVDLYGREFVEEYITVARVRPGWRDVLRRYDVAQVLLPKDSQLVAVLREDPAWRVVLEGDEEVLLQRVAP
jgi:hypothetical protein